MSEIIYILSLAMSRTLKLTWGTNLIRMMSCHPFSWSASIGIVPLGTTSSYLALNRYDSSKSSILQEDPWGLRSMHRVVSEIAIDSRVGGIWTDGGIWMDSIIALAHALSIAQNLGLISRLIVKGWTVQCRWFGMFSEMFRCILLANPWGSDWLLC